ncbi:hypothetical protein NEOLEDRAFT_1021411, partial [Neolentinus lepideus HHB14362 ss-1]
NSLIGSTEVSVIISLRSCTTDSSSGLREMGTVLYSVRCNPQYSDTGEEMPPHKNYSVAV